MFFFFFLIFYALILFFHLFLYARITEMVYWQKRLWNEFCSQGSSGFGSSFTLFISQILISLESPQVRHWFSARFLPFDRGYAEGRGYNLSVRMKETQPNNYCYYSAQKYKSFFLSNGWDDVVILLLDYFASAFVH